MSSVVEVENQRWGNFISAVGQNGPPTGGSGLFVKYEVWERWISITRGAGTAFPCVQWHFNHWMSLFNGNVGQLRWLLSTVHSQQQECTANSQECAPNRQECTVGSEASEAWQTFRVNNVSQFRLSLERIVD